MSKDPDLRFERKFDFLDLAEQEIVSMLKLHPAVFSEIYHLRSVNNIYFDTHNHQYLSDSVQGHSTRQKVRIRWYGDLFGEVASPHLEIKLKKGQTGEKARFLLNNFNCDEDLSLNYLLKIVQESKIPEHIKMRLNSLSCVLLNRYDRRYFLSQDKNFRVTVDTNLAYYHLSPLKNSFLRKFEDSLRTIVELKYNISSADQAADIVNKLPFRLRRFSKYVEGMKRLS